MLLVESITDPVDPPPVGATPPVTAAPSAEDEPPPQADTDVTAAPARLALEIDFAAREVVVRLGDDSDPVKLVHDGRWRLEGGDG